jgi:CubicO group peptidase (beta-lactamase class C family)
MMLFNGTLDGARILGRKAMEKMTTRAIHNLPDYCWGAKDPDYGYGVGFDMRNWLAFTWSPATFMHEGSGRTAMIIDPTEELVAVYIIPQATDDWFPRAAYNPQNIIWSGLK